MKRGPHLWLGRRVNLRAMLAVARHGLPVPFIGRAGRPAGVRMTLRRKIAVVRSDPA